MKRSHRPRSASPSTPTPNAFDPRPTTDPVGGPSPYLTPNARITASPAEVEPTRLMTAEEVAELAGVSVRTLRRRVADGFLRKAPIGGRALRFSVAEVARMNGASRDFIAEENAINSETC